MIKPFVRRVIRALASRLLLRPALAEPLKNLVRRFPQLDRRLRRIVATPPAAVAAATQQQAPGTPPAPIPPEVARILVDLRQAGGKS